jgi:hypothetical protein
MKAKVGQVWKILKPHNRLPGVLASFTITRVEPPYAYAINGRCERKIKLDRLEGKNYRYFKLLREAL